MTNIHSTAVVDPRAELGSNVEVGPYSVIGPKVRIGRDTCIKSHVVVEGNTALGEGNLIFQFAALGSVPQDLKYRGEDSQLIVGHHNTIREFASLNPGTAGGGMITRVGDGNLLMMYCHIAHDCIIGDQNIIANGATLGGHVIVENHVIVGGLVGIHQFVRVGTGAIVGAGSMVSKDVPPFCTAAGDRVRIRGLNLKGLRRKGFTSSQIDALRKAYRIIFRSGLRVQEALDRVKREVPPTHEVGLMLRFIEQSRRGICR